MNRRTARLRIAARVLHRARIGDLIRGMRDVAICCGYCHDSDGGCVYPYYGVAPHTHDTSAGWIGSTRLVPDDQWPTNFEPDAEDSGCGTYTHCLHCGAGA